MADAPTDVESKQLQAGTPENQRLWNEGNTELGYHAQQRMKQRKLDMNDIANCIRYGKIIEHTKPMTYWRYTILGKGVDGKTMKCVVEINGNLIVVTVI